MMKTIEELWYGNISPFELCTRGDKRLKELLKLVARNREELGETLTDKQKETLEKFEECMNEMHLHKIDIEANEMLETIIPRLATKRGIDENLKARDMLRWVAEMNNIKASAEEIVLREVVLV